MFLEPLSRLIRVRNFEMSGDRIYKKLRSKNYEENND